MPPDPKCKAVKRVKCSRCARALTCWGPEITALKREKTLIEGREKPSKKTMLPSTRILIEGTMDLKTIPPSNRASFEEAMLKKTIRSSMEAFVKGGMLKKTISPSNRNPIEGGMD